MAPEEVTRDYYILRKVLRCWNVNRLQKNIPLFPNTCTHSVYVHKHFYVAHPQCPYAVYIGRIIGRVVG